MTLRKLALTIGLAAMAVIATAASAFAATAYAASSVNVRSGPGTNYRVVDTLQRGERVDVLGCRGSWCQVEKPGPDGWVSARYLTSGGDYYDDGYYDDDYVVVHPRPRVRHRPNVHFHDDYYYPRYRPHASFCLGGDHASFCINGY